MDNEHESFRQRADQLLSQMTLEEKCGQMLHQAPAIERLGLPRYSWWNECLHGVGRSGVATVFPQSIGLAATFDPALVRKIYQAVSDEARAKHNAAAAIGNASMGTGLTFWTPNINIFRDPRWGRGHETYGEDPYLTSQMGVACIQGLQGDDPKWLKTAACAKHYAVHSGPEPLRHTFNAKVSQRDLWQTYLPAFEAAVRQGGVESVMGAYNRTNDDLCCAHPTLIGQILRGQWGFGGHVVSDCGAIEDFHTHHKVTLLPEESAALAVRRGCDLCCGTVYDQLPLAVKKGLLSEAEIDTAVRRLLITRLKLGLIDTPADLPYNRIPASVVNSAAHRRLARQAARQSIVLLKNDGILPLDKQIKRLLICGPNYDSIEVLLGNYNGFNPQLTTILEGVVGKLHAGTSMVEDRKCPLMGTLPIGPGALNWISQECDAIIAVMGLTPRIEGEEGDALSDAGGDRRRIELPEAQEKYLQLLKQTGKPIVLVLTGGSAIAVPWAQENCQAIMQVFYPGQEGGAAVGEVLFGDYNPSGRLPFTVPQSTEQLPAFEDYCMNDRTYRYLRQRPLYAFGHGLSYTTFSYSDMKLSAAKLRRGGSVRVQVRLTNTGRRAGDEVAQLYCRDTQPGLEDAAHTLRRFKRLHLRPGQSRTLAWTLRADDFLPHPQSGIIVSLPRDYQIFIGGGQPGYVEGQSTTLTLES